ncbi:MAG: hypothetical protein V5B33_19465 [Candidatus Accumulibacter sp. UW20]|jgi:hypothetical protein
MLLFFFLLMLAMAWGVADHYQSFLHKSPPPAPVPIKVEAPAHQLPPVLLPESAPRPNDVADDANAVAPDRTGKTEAVDNLHEKP